MPSATNKHQPSATESFKQILGSLGIQNALDKKDSDRIVKSFEALTNKLDEIRSVNSQTASSTARRQGMGGLDWPGCSLFQPAEACDATGKARLLGPPMLGCARSTPPTASTLKPHCKSRCL